MINQASSSEAIANFISGRPEDQEAIRGMFRKFIKVSSYLQLKKKQLPYAIAHAHLLGKDPNYAKKNTEDQIDDQEDLLEDEVFYEQNVQPVLNKYFASSISNKTAS
ncbi:MAG: hypothetical protein H6765_06225 [Candidatus Peribacteria bacterium]|nr:MAG: hypothetical protein H6765_06225 [Candidatus Peribacteria bacterium]